MRGISQAAFSNETEAMFDIDMFVLIATALEGEFEVQLILKDGTRYAPIWKEKT